MLRVLTWNLWWRHGPWEQRQAAIRETLRDEAPDVACLQEVWAEEGGRDQAELLASELGLSYVRTPARYWDGVSFGNAILSRWPVRSTTWRSLPGRDGRPSHRSVLLAVLDTPAGPWPVVTTHLEWRYDASEVRIAQARVLAAFVAGCRTDPERDLPPVVTGDLNATPVSDEIRSLTGHGPAAAPGLVLHDAWEQVGEGPGHTWDGANPYLSEATWPGRRLDYVLVAWPRPRPIGNPVACRLVGTAPVAGVVPSDHYGVVADLRDGR